MSALTSVFGALRERMPGGAPAWRLLLGFVLIGALSGWIGFKAMPAVLAGEVVKFAGYQALAAIFVWWLFACSALARTRGWLAGWRRGRRPGRDAWVALAWISALTLVAVATVPKVYKVLFDEAVIQSTAWNMHAEREVGYVNRMHEVEGVPRSLESALDKRPYFFPFLVSLMHDVAGVREGNAFALNLALMPVVLGLLWLLARRLAGAEGARVALVSLGAFSLLALNANGAGLEMLNLALILGVTLAACLYLENPDAPSLSVLVLTTVLLANTRYESAIYVGCAALVIAEGWRRAGRFILPPAAIFAPVLLIPYALHNTYLSGTPRLWELREGNETRFSFDYLAANLGFARTFFFNVGPGVANSIWLTGAGLVAAAGLAVWAWRRKTPWTRWSPSSSAVALCGLGVAGNLALLMAYYWGDLSDPVVSRLSLPFHALLALIVAAAVGLVPSAWRTRVASGAITVALLCYVAWGLRVNQYLGKLNGLEVANRWEEKWLAERGPARRLIISDKGPMLWFCRSQPAVTMVRVLRRPDALAFHLAHHTFDEVLVTQTLVPAPTQGGYWIAPEHRLPENYVLETLATRRFGTKIDRISLLKEIRPKEPSSDDKPAETSAVSEPSAQS